jgi:hypothetical protein
MSLQAGTPELLTCRFAQPELVYTVHQLPKRSRALQVLRKGVQKGVQKAARKDVRKGRPTAGC